MAQLSKVCFFENAYCKPDENEKKWLIESRERGTVAHIVAAAILRAKIENRGDNLHEKNFYLDQIPYQKQVYLNDKMVKNGESYADFIISIYNKEKNKDPSATIKIEKIIDCSDYAANCIGTPDCFILSENEIYVFDYKYGEIPINAMENAQLKIYALGVLSMYEQFAKNVKHVRLFIFQPELGKKQFKKQVFFAHDKNVSEWTITPIELKNWGNFALKRAVDQIKNNPTRAEPGDWCRYCRGQKNCEEYVWFFLDRPQNRDIDHFFELVNEEKIDEFKKRYQYVRVFLEELDKLTPNEEIRDFELQKGLFEEINLKLQPHKYELMNPSEFKFAKLDSKSLTRYKGLPLSFLYRNNRYEPKSISEIRTLIYKKSEEEPLIIERNKGELLYVLTKKELLCHLNASLKNLIEADVLNSCIELDGEKYIIAKKNKNDFDQKKLKKIDDICSTVADLMNSIDDILATLKKCSKNIMLHQEKKTEFDDLEEQ